jgi:hypothetical protein
MLRMDFDGDGVAHCSGGNEERRLFAEDLSGSPLQQVDGGVLAVDVVADLGRGHGAPHLLCWLSDRVTPQIDHTNS